MRIITWLMLVSLLVMRAGAPSNAPVRLAVIAETERASAAGDFLTVEFSKNPRVTLLERNDIERVYREQGLSAANRDFLKLGQVLGADGVLLVSAIATTNETGLRIRLIAVKPGVVLANERYSPPNDLSAWSTSVANQLNLLLPKLSVLVQDTVPVSVVNFRSAIQSPETKAVERQLTGLAIERLSRERQLIVLERTKMQLLAAEKELKGLGDSAFWNGSYLLEGTLDRDGYSPGKITISARLVPPKGGAPVPIEVSGSRTNFPQAVDQLAEKVRESLKLVGAAAPWNPAEEAQKFYEEAQWALKWGLLEQAQSASDSAWTLGKRDQDCALARLSAYSRAIPEVDPVTIRHIDLKNEITYVSVSEPPKPQEADLALHLLETYLDFGRTLPANEPQQDSSYYISGLSALQKATGVLRHFYFHPEARPAVEEKLVDLRTLARDVDAWMGRSPTVRKTYWMGEHIPSNDEFYNDFKDDSGRYQRLNLVRNLYQMELQSGRFWQEKPEDCLTLYRSLMESPIFAAIQNDLWFMGEGGPLTAWRAGDEKQLPALWMGFVASLDTSTNAFLQMEGRVYQFQKAQASRRNAGVDTAKVRVAGEDALKIINSIYAERDRQVEIAWTNLFNFVFEHYDEIITSREQLLFIGLGLDKLIPQEGEVIPALEKSKTDYRTVYTARLNTLHEEYVSRFSERLAEMQGLPTFSYRKQYLAKFTPYDSAAFSKLFQNQNFSKAQAAELKPLIGAYRSNLVAQATNNTAKFFAEANSRNIKTFFEDKLDDILNPKPPGTEPVAAATIPAVPPTANAGPKPAIVQPDNPTNALVAKIFLGFPTNQLPATNITSIVVFGHRMRDDKLVLDLRYMDRWWVHESTNSGRQVTVYREAAAILQPHSGWRMTAFPHYGDSITGSGDFIMGNFGVSASTSPQLYLEIFENDLYVSDRDAIRRYDAKENQWHELPFPGQDRAQLFVVNARLYAASSEGIWEILDRGQSVRIMASTRRTPPASALDSRDSLGHPVLFSGRNKSLWVAVNGEVLSWEGGDWKSVLTIPGAFPPEIYQGTALFKAGKFPQSIELWRLSPDETEPVLCLDERPIVQPGMTSRPPMQPQRNSAVPAPLWKEARGVEHARNPLTIDGNAIYLIAMPADAIRTRTTDDMVKGRPLEADLVCLVPESREPFTIPIRLDANAGPVAVTRGPAGSGVWIECSSEYLFIGASSLRGVWALPKAEIRLELDRQIRKRPPSPKEETAEDRQRALLAKYDLNHNGQFDADERELAISDPAFLESEIDKIDANGNYIVDPSELAGIQAAQQILAMKDLKQFDADENGRLDQEEYRAFTRGKRPSQNALRAMQFQPAATEVERLRHYLERMTEESVQQGPVKPGPGPAGYLPMLRPDQLQLNPTLLKQEIESYWAKQRAGS